MTLIPITKRTAYCFVDFGKEVCTCKPINTKIMISANEFRIGNYVNTKYGNLKVFTVNPDGLEVEDESGFITYFESNKLKPIALTEEILLKYGFIESSKHDFKLMLKICGINLYCRFNTEWYFELEGIYLGSKPKYLHELQNLYFSLIGSELTIKGL